MSKSFAQKKVAILGLSTEGRDTAKYFVQKGAQVYGCDRRTAESLGPVSLELERLGVHLKLGPNYLQDLHTYDVLVRTPGMALSLPELVEAHNQGIPITSATREFMEVCRAPIIGVTGTKGKGTASTLIYHMLRTEGKTAWLGGNIGVPLLSQVENISDKDWVVLELSSFQLEDAHVSPHIAVVLRVTQDHLANNDPLASNYHRDRDDYVRAKKNIVIYQNAKDYAVFYADDLTSSSFALETPAQKYFYSRTNKRAQAYIENAAVYLTEDQKKHLICRLDDIKLRGVHNLENIAAAVLAARSAGVSIDTIRTVAHTFKGLEHRLEEVARIDDVLYINDSFSSIPETSIAALQSFKEPVILIAGGSEKGSDFTELGKEIAHSSVKVRDYKPQ